LNSRRARVITVFEFPFLRGAGIFLEVHSGCAQFSSRPLERKNIHREEKNKLFSREKIKRKFKFRKMDFEKWATDVI
jgi:hypothetical protein